MWLSSMMISYRLKTTIQFIHTVSTKNLTAKYTIQTWLLSTKKDNCRSLFFIPAYFIKMELNVLRIRNIQPKILYWCYALREEKALLLFSLCFQREKRKFNNWGKTYSQTIYTHNKISLYILKIVSLLSATINWTSI